MEQDPEPDGAMPNKSWFFEDEQLKIHFEKRIEARKERGGMGQ